ncbi:DUF3013 family protein [Hutsoniella sourekii]|uniref:DUF3013 family protein n=1 Tax=Hutsoniella sourekii TaxID=87650 RepID=UPI0004860CA8|nr:DUF3013 family protein [Hutsoniella sourekii]
MEITNLKDVLILLMDEAYFQCEWLVEGQQSSPVLTLTLQFQFDNPHHITFIDQQGQEVHADPVPFETNIYFYRPDILVPNRDRCLCAFPVDPQLGIPYGELVVIVKYLRIIANSSRSQWWEFILQNQSGTFQLKWNDKEFNQHRELMMDRHRYSYSRVYMD